MISNINKLYVCLTLNLPLSISVFLSRFAFLCLSLSHSVIFFIPLSLSLSLSLPVSPSHISLYLTSSAKRADAARPTSTWSILLRAGHNKRNINLVGIGTSVTSPSSIECDSLKYCLCRSIHM